MKTPKEQIVDELLVLHAQGGNSQALEQLVKRWQRPLWKYAWRLSSDSEAAWDIVQEAWLSIIKGLWRLDDPAAFRPWAYRIVTNKTADWIKRKARRQKNRQTLDPDTHSASPDPGAEDTEETRQLIDRLPVKFNQVLTLYYLEDFSVTQIADTLAIPEGTVKSRLYKARAELKRIYNRHQRNT